MAEVDNAFVKQGLWTDFSRGNVMGKTITTDPRTGTIVVSVLAILSSFAAAHLWNIVAFVVHQMRAKGRPRNGLFWQQQAVLRTLPTPSALLADNIYLWWRWRKRVPQSVSSLSFQILLPLFFSVAAISVTIFTSLLVSTSNIQVLIQSPYCSRYNNSGYRDDFNQAYARRMGDIAINYRNVCYRDDEFSPAFCQNIYVKSRLPLTVSNGSCPFDESICEAGNLTSINMDTGILDLASDFGLNLMQGEGMKIRKQTACTVLPFEQYCKIVNASKDDIPTQILDAQYMGQNFISGLKSILAFLGPKSSAPQSYGNATIGAPLIPTSDIRAKYGIHNSKTGVISSSFGLSQRRSIGTHRWTGYSGRAIPSSWKPLPELQKPDADPSIILFILRGLALSRPVDDPLFAVHRNVEVSAYNGDGSMETVYTSDYPAGLLGCTEKNEFCIEHPNKTLSCVHMFSDTVPAFLETLSSFQKAVFDLVSIVSLDANMVVAIEGGFNASTKIRGEPTLPNDQWIIEAKRLMAFDLAYMQVLFPDYAIGPEVRASQIREGVDRPVTEGERQLCAAQKMRKAGGFVNINFFGFVFTVVLSSSVVITDLLLLKILVHLSRFRRTLAPRIDRWTQDGIFQLQRRAFEASGQGAWEDLESEIPITSTGNDLEELSNSAPLPFKVASSETNMGL